MNQKKILTGTLIILAAAAFLILLALLPSVHSASEEDLLPKPRTKICYENYEVQPNDSLWKIAEEHAASYEMKTADYVVILRKMNHLSGDRIVTGQKLILPYKTY